MSHKPYGRSSLRQAVVDKPSEEFGSRPGRHANKARFLTSKVPGIIG